MSTETLTVDTTNSGSRGGEWEYIDKNGGRHAITNGQTLTFTLTDGGTTNVRLVVDGAQTMTTDDGYTIYPRQMNSGGNVAHELKLRDAYQNGTADYQVPGEISIECPVTGIVQHWKVAICDINDVDSPATIARLKLEDQFGNVMDLPSDDAGTITFA